MCSAPLKKTIKLSINILKETKINFFCVCFLEEFTIMLIRAVDLGDLLVKKSDGCEVEI
jgi:hypothetical protein